MKKYHVRHHVTNGWHLAAQGARSVIRLGTCQVCKSRPCGCPRTGLHHTIYTDGTSWGTDRPWLWSGL